MKMDIEGAEFSVIPRFHRAFKQRRPVLLLSVHGYHYLERFPRLPGRARWAAQHIISAAGRMRILLALRPYANRWQWQKDSSQWRLLTQRSSLNFVISLQDTQLVFSDGDLPPMPRI